MSKIATAEKGKLFVAAHAAIAQAIKDGYSISRSASSISHIVAPHFPKGVTAANSAAMMQYGQKVKQSILAGESINQRWGDALDESLVEAILDEANLDDGTDYLPLPIAARQYSVEPEALRRAVRSGKVDGRKQGRFWFVRRQTAEAYAAV